MVDNEPLGLPTGSVRSILAIIIVVGSLLIFTFTDKLQFEGLMALIAVPTSLYFGQYMKQPGE